MAAHGGVFPSDYAAIRALPDPARASVPIIAMTANAYEEDRNEALEAGMNGYVSKPIDVEAIRAALARALSERKPEDH